MLDLLCMGRAAVDLYAEQIGSSLEKTTTFAKYVGGCPANIAIGSSRLGLKTGILSRVGNEAMGRYVRDTCLKEGVDISHLKTDYERLTALVLLGINPPDRFPLIFYRENCADMAIDETDFDKDTFTNTKSLLITGTHCSNERIFDITKKAVLSAKKCGCKIILDIDYRPVLWGVAGHGEGEARYKSHSLVSDRLSSLYQLCDLIVGTEEEILAGTNNERIKDALQTLRNQTTALIVCKKGEQGCLAYPNNINSPVTGNPYTIKVLNVLGAGDAFMSGFLRGYLKDLPIEECCNLGNANGALVVTRHGCSPAMPYWDELKYFMQSPNDIKKCEHMHLKYSKDKFYKPLALLAFDHRSYFDNYPKQKVLEFKSLLLKAFETIQANKMQTGLILDDIFGFNSIKKATEKNLLIFKCIEDPNSNSLSFLNDQEASKILTTWPKDHGIKILCNVTKEHKNTILKKLSDLYQATKCNGHRLLIEFKSDNPSLIHEMIQQCYEKEIYPDFWKLPFNNLNLQKTVQKNDPHCQGILILGNNKQLNEIKKEILSTPNQGFAIGRTIWHDAFQKWIQNNLDDDKVINQVASNFSHLIEAWESHYDTFDEKKVDLSYSDNSTSPDTVPL